MNKFFLITINSFQTLPPVKQLLHYFKKYGEIICIHNRIFGFENFFQNINKEHIIAEYDDLIKFKNQSLLSKFKKYAKCIFIIFYEIWLGRSLNKIYLYTNDIIILYILSLLNPSNAYIIYHQFEMIIPSELNRLDRFVLSRFQREFITIDLLIFPESNRRDYFLSLIKNHSAYDTIIIPNTNNNICRLEVEYNSKVIIGHVGALGKSHNIINFLECINSLDDDNIEYWFVGYVEQDIKELIKKSTNQQIKLFNQVKHNQLNEIYKYFDLGLILYSDVSLHFKYCAPNKLYEYWSCGIPVLADKLPGLLDLNFNSKLGNLIDMSSKEEFLSAIKSIRKLPIKTRKDIQEIFRKEYMLDNFIVKLETIING